MKEDPLIFFVYLFDIIKMTAALLNKARTFPIIIYASFLDSSEYHIIHFIRDVHRGTVLSNLKGDKR